MITDAKGALIETLHKEHKNYSVLLDLLGVEAGKLEHGHEPDLVRINDIANYMVSYPEDFPSST